MADTAELVRLMRRYNQRMFRACRSVLRDAAEAEDAVQDAWLSAWKHLPELEDPSRVGAWLTRIAVREAMAHARRNARFDLEDTVATDPSPSPEREASDREVGRVIEDAIDELPHEFRTVFVLRLVEGLSLAETADSLDIPAETVKTRLHRARRRVADRLLSRLDAQTREVFAFDGERCDRIVTTVLRRIA